MRKFDAAVTDTHALMFHGSGGGRSLGPRAAALFRAADEGDALVYVPLAVLMEITFLARAGRGGLRVPLASFINQLFANPCYQPLDLSLEQLMTANEININRDFYDSMIVAAAVVLGLPLITRDSAIVDSGVVKVLW